MLNLKKNYFNCIYLLGDLVIYEYCIYVMCVCKYDERGLY